MKFLYNPPSVVKRLFNSYHWNSGNGEILITFDDGPIQKNSERILQRLKEKNSKALFFCVGNNVLQNKGLASEILAEGHSIGNHTFNHKKLHKLSLIEATKEIDDFNELMLTEFNYKVNYFRPPHGIFTFGLNSLLKEREMKNIMWSLLTYDYLNDTGKVKNAIKNYLRKDSIIVFHDSYKSETIILDCLDILYEEVEQKGFVIGSAAECLK